MGSLFTAKDAGLLFQYYRSKKISELRVTGLCAGHAPVTGEFPAQIVSYTEKFSIWL